MGDLFQPWHLLVLWFVFSGFFVVPTIFYVLTLRRALANCAPTSRTLDSAMLWLLLVPVVGRIWHFFVVSGMANSLQNEFLRRNLPPEAERPGYSIGSLASICPAC